MKKLILPLMIVPFLASANEMQISDHDIKSKFLTVVKDAEVEGLLSKTAEFNKCREKNEYKPNQDVKIKEANLKKASECFKAELENNTDTKALQKLSENLQLQNYGLVKSKNISEITEYLSKKMHKALTGVDPDDKNPENQKWENQKIVDQKVFIDLYTNQLMKGALFEVSRFCFENLERDNSVKTDTDFATYWTEDFLSKNMLPDLKKDPTGKKLFAVTTGLNDTGSTSFFKISTDDLSKKENVYGDIKKGLSKSAEINPIVYGKFFAFCQSALPQLCEDFKKSTDVTNSQKNTSTSVGSTMTKGANACLTMEKLKSIRTILANTEKVAKQFDEMEDKNTFALKMIKNPKIYQRGKGEGEESLDELTSVSSSDMLTEGQDDKLSKLEEECEKGKGGADCDQFLVEGDSLDKAIHNVESEMNLKREIEMARARELAKKPEDLKKYLTDNGHFDLLEKLEKDPKYDIGTELGKIYDARKVAEIQSLKLKVGRRQVTEAESKELDDTKAKAGRIVDNIKDTKEERARLAQVVMFNNIITSQLKLEDKDGKEVGRNVTGLKRELEGLGDYDPALFKGLKEEAKNGSKLDDISISGGGIIDSILGKAPKSP